MDKDEFIGFFWGHISRPGGKESQFPSFRFLVLGVGRPGAGAREENLSTRAVDAEGRAGLWVR